jgi:hypothetical protein
MSGNRVVGRILLKLILILYSPMVTMYTTYINILRLCSLPTECILFLVCLVLAINSEYFPKQHQPTGLCSGDVMCISCEVRIEFLFVT